MCLYNRYRFSWGISLSPSLGKRALNDGPDEEKRFISRFGVDRPKHASCCCFRARGRERERESNSTFTALCRARRRTRGRRRRPLVDDVIEKNFDTLDFLASFFFREKEEDQCFMHCFLGGAKKCGDHHQSYHRREQRHAKRARAQNF